MSSHAMTPSVDAMVAGASAEHRQPAPSTDAATVVHVVGFWRRVAAASVDAALLAPVLLAALWIACLVAGVDGKALRALRIEAVLDLFLQGSPAVFATLGVVLLLVVLYQLLFLTTATHTPGMRLLGAQLIDIYGQRPELSRVAIRCLGWLAGLAVLGLGSIWIAFDREKRGLHDWLSGTYVVRRTNVPQESR